MFPDPALAMRVDHNRPLSAAPTTDAPVACTGLSASADSLVSGHWHGAPMPAATQSLASRLPAWAIDELAWPLLAFLAANLLLVVLGGDRWIADGLFAAEGGRWALQDSIVTTTLIHIGGKRLSALAWVAVVAAVLLAWRVPRLRAYRDPLLRLAGAVLLSTALVSVLKHLTHMDCPWDMQGYGGLRPYLDLFDPRPSGLRSSGCFPAGHASAGYAWVALYFFARAVAPRWRWRALWVGLGAGLLFGVSQQLRGAHFLSHDAWTLMLCWLSAVLVHRLPWRGERWRHDASTARRGPLAW